MLYLWDLGSISTHIGFFVIILPILQSFFIVADKRWSFIVFPVLVYEATSPTLLVKPIYLKTVSVPDGASELQPDKATN